jgi:predicted Zn-dependent protease
MKRIHLLLVLVFFTIVLPSCQWTPEDTQRLGMASMAFVQGFRPISYQEMADISLCVASRIAGLAPVYDRDPKLTKYVNMVALTVGHYSDRPDFNYRVLLLDAPNEVNAYTTADGRIFVTTGLLAAVRDESELAGVLGHEIAHAAREHILKAMQTQRKTQGIVNAAAIMLQDNGAFAAVANGAFDAIVLKPRSREQESEADTYGMYYAEAAGYDPQGLLNFLAFLRDQSGPQGSASSVFATHPALDQRVNDVANSIKTNFRPHKYSTIMVTTAAGRKVERAQYYTTALRMNG